MIPRDVVQIVAMEEVVAEEAIVVINADTLMVEVMEGTVIVTDAETVIDVETEIDAVATIEVVIVMDAVVTIDAVMTTEAVKINVIDQLLVLMVPITVLMKIEMTANLTIEIKSGSLHRTLALEGYNGQIRQSTPRKSKPSGLPMKSDRSSWND